jgi:thiamine biosynthesis lipoprotein
MGTRAQVIVTARALDHAEPLARAAAHRLAELERRWSRFRADSEITELNAGNGEPVAVSRETALLVDRAVEAWHRTGGAFDPTVLPALVAAGYDRDFRRLRAEPAPPAPLDPTAAPGCDGIVVQGSTVALPAGVCIDPGGIGKGLAADLVVELVMTAGADGACVNVGGDLRVAGHGPDATPWTVTVEHPLGERDIGTIRLHDEALVSSWRTRRTWGPTSAPRHHLIDPATGAPAFTGLAGVTVLARDAWWAEAVATALFLAGSEGAAEVVAHHGVSALLVRDDGAVRTFGRFGPPMAA